jgi:hypothetical protein
MKNLLTLMFHACVFRSLNFDVELNYVDNSTRILSTNQIYEIGQICILPEIFSSSPDTRVFVARKLHEGARPRVILSDKHECCKKKFLAIYTGCPKNGVLTVHYGVEETAVNVRKIFKNIYWTYLLIWRSLKVALNR